jgi:hypothetical protein
MPLFIDPAWEYFTPDSEVAEADLFPTSRNLFDDRLYKAGALGVRFGRGSPDHPRLHLARRLPFRHDAVLYHVPCLGCSAPFLPDRFDRSYCCRRCVPRPGRAPTRPVSVCACCSAPFRPRWDGHRYCSLSCASRSNRGHGKTAGCDDEFRTLYLSGAPVAAICSRFGIQKKAVRVWRDRLSLTPRPPGNHRRPCA